MSTKSEKHRKQRANAQKMSLFYETQSLHAEVKRRFGLLPNFFNLPTGNIEITANLWGFALIAYLDNPLPSLFKERLFVYLSRFCKVRYCVTRHFGFLIGLGNVAGDSTAPPQSINEVMSLLKRTLPHAERLERIIEELNSIRSPLMALPESDSSMEQMIFACAAHVFLESQSFSKCFDALKKTLPESRFQSLLILLAFVRTAHFWTAVQTSLRLENDIEQFLATHKEVADLLLNDPEMNIQETSKKVMEELESLRVGNFSNERLLLEEKVHRQKQEAAISKATNDLAQRVTELERANQEIQNARRAALNLMEDAILSKEALRINERRIRMQKEAFQSVVNAGTLDESLNIMSRLVLEETQGAARTAFYIANRDYTALHPVRGAGNMPEAYLDQIDGFLIGKDSFTCGLAVSTNEVILTTDVYAEPRWKRWISVADEFHYRACWSFPIKSKENKAIGTFAMYFQSPREATPRDIALAEIVTQSAAIIISNNLDVGKRDRAERALQESEDRLSIAVETAIDFAIININKEGLVVGWNSGAERLFGYSASEIVGKPTAIIFTDEDQAANVPEVEMATAKVTGVASDERWHKRKDGSRFYVSGVMRPIYNPVLSGFVKIARDMTEQKLLEQQKDDFIGIASHELKTPVTSIKAYTEFLLEAFTESKDLARVELLTKLDTQVDRLTGLINALLDTTRIAEGQLLLAYEKFNLNELIEERMNELQRTTYSHKLIFSTTVEVCVTADKERIAQVITNLISNAVKYSPKGGEVRIQLDKKAEGVQVSVRDNGVGIPEDLKEKIFGRFYRVRNAQTNTYPGIGLGLYISAAIIKRHNGKIWVDSKLNQGSTFYFLLPYNEISN